MNARFALLAGALLLGYAAAQEPEAELLQAEKLLREARIGSEGADVVRFFRDRSLSEEDHQRLTAAVEQLGNANFQKREKAVEELRRAGRKALPFLRAALRDGDLERARRAQLCIDKIDSSAEMLLLQAAAHVLAQRRPKEATEALLRYFPVAGDSAVEEAVLKALASVSVKDGTPDPLLLKALADKESLRRVAAVHVLGRAAGQRDALRPLLTDPDARVRFETADVLVRAADRTAVPVMIALLGEGPRALAWQAQELLYHLAGDKAPLGLTSEANRVKVRADWDRWWKESTIDLAKVSFADLDRGLIVICEAESANVPCRVWECGRDGKLRWEIKGLDSPSDAQVLPGGRILIAESHPRRVTERDPTGKILWTKTVGNYLTTCQRLPGGNTLLGSYNEVLEVTPEGKTVYSLKSPLPGSSYSAQKLPNGNIVVINDTKVRELDTKGTTVRETTVPRPNNTFARIEVLRNGHYLVALYGGNKVVEFDTTGKIHWECTVNSPSSAVRLRNGNTLVSSMNARVILEFDRGGKEVWKVATQNRPFRVRRY